MNFINKGFITKKLSPCLLALYILNSCMTIPKETSPAQKDTPASLNIKSGQIKKPVTFQNGLFWDVTVKRQADGKYTVNGKVKGSLASFDYVVEDGHYQLIKGIIQTEKINPEWNGFRFTFEVKKKDFNNNLILGLYKGNPDTRVNINVLTIPLN